MPKKQFSPEIKKLFEVVSGSIEGYWIDEISVDKMIIEANHCPKCHRSLEYKAFSNTTEYRAFGICANCEYAKEFWLEAAGFAGFKKKICEAVAKTSAAARN